MTRANYCEFFRFHDGYCDVFVEDDHLLYAEMEAYYNRHPFVATCKEYKPAGVDDVYSFKYDMNGFIVSDYAGADVEYLQTLTPAHETIAREIIASEERYTLECMASDYGYTRQYVVDYYREMIDAGDDPHAVYEYIAACMMEHDL